MHTWGLGVLSPVSVSSAPKDNRAVKDTTVPAPVRRTQETPGAPRLASLATTPVSLNLPSATTL